MGNALSKIKKSLEPIFERNRELEEYRYLSNEEKISLMKERFNLTHGKGKAKRKK